MLSERTGRIFFGKVKSPASFDTGPEDKPLKVYGLLAVGNGQAACGFRVV